MANHEIHVTGWDDWAELALVCNAGPGTPCHVVTDEYGGNPQPVESCNAVEWWGNCSPEDLIHGRFTGPPPWAIDVTWTDDGPELRQATPSACPDSSLLAWGQHLVDDATEAGES